jgi:hypothetical protein
MYKSATKCNETIGKWYKNKHGASKIIDTFETYQWVEAIPTKSADGETSLKMLKDIFFPRFGVLTEVLILFMAVLEELLLDMTLIIELLLLIILKLVGR